MGDEVKARDPQALARVKLQGLAVVAVVLMVMGTVFGLGYGLLFLLVRTIRLGWGP